MTIYCGCIFYFSLQEVHFVKTGKGSILKKPKAVRSEVFKRNESRCLSRYSFPIPCYYNFKSVSASTQNMIQDCVNTGTKSFILNYVTSLMTKNAAGVRSFQASDIDQQNFYRLLWYINKMN